MVRSSRVADTALPEAGEMVLPYSSVSSTRRIPEVSSAVFWRFSDLATIVVLSSPGVIYTRTYRLGYFVNRVP